MATLTKNPDDHCPPGAQELMFSPEHLFLKRQALLTASCQAAFGPVMQSPMLVWYQWTN